MVWRGLKQQTQFSHHMHSRSERILKSNVVLHCLCQRSTVFCDELIFLCRLWRVSPLWPPVPRLATRIHRIARLPRYSLPRPVALAATPAKVAAVKVKLKRVVVPVPQPAVAAVLR